MNRRIAGKDNRFGRKLVSGGCLAGAAILLIVAFTQGDKQNSAAGWVPLNEAVEEALAELEAGREGGGEAGIQAADADQNEQDAGTAEAEQLGDAVQAASTREAAASSGGEAALTSRDDAGRLDLNRATADELDGLKGIGPSKAQAIVEDRDKNGFFASVEDLLRVKGIGEKLLAGIKDSVVTRP